MAFPIIPGRLKRLWDEWNLRSTVLISLFFQVGLVCCAASRKRMRNKILIATIWLFYLLADWFAAFAVGLISNGQSNECPGKFAVNQDLAAFWAPFLLLHLGGPDNITAFSLEDNELWIRHLLGLVIQVVAVGYVFSQSLPNALYVPTILLFFAATIRYAERTWALYSACLGNLKDSMLPVPDAGPNYAQLMEEYSSKETAGVPVHIETVKEPEGGTDQTFAASNREEENLNSESIDHLDILQNGYELFTTFRGLIVDHMFSFHERSKSRKFFFQRTASDAFRVMEVELNFMYDTLYTKMAVVHCKTGYFLRLICSVLIVLSFERFSSHDYHKLIIKHDSDVANTFILLSRAVLLDFVGLVMLIFSDWTIVKLKNRRVRSAVYAVRQKLSFNSKKWSNKVSQHNLINFCLNSRWKWLDGAAKAVGIRDVLDEMYYKKDNQDMVLQEGLKEFIFQELKLKAIKAKTTKVAKEIYSARGEWALMSEYTRQYYRHNLIIESSVGEELEYDESLLQWHIATEICYNRTKTLILIMIMAIPTANIVS